MSKPKILIVEDESIVAKDIENILTSNGFGISGIATNAKEALNKIETEKPDLILLDIILNGDMDGIELAYKIQQNLNIPIVYLTTLSDSDTINKVKDTKPLGFIVKPFEERELIINLEIALLRDVGKEKDLDAIYNIFENINDLIIAADKNENIIFMNKAAEKEYNCKLSDVYGTSVKGFLKSKLVNNTIRIRNSNYKILKIGSDNNESIYILSSNEPDLSKNDELFEYLDEIIIVFDVNFKIKNVSKNITKKLGYLKSELVGRYIFDIINKNDNNNFFKLLFDRNCENNELRLVDVRKKVHCYSVKSEKYDEISDNKDRVLVIQDISSWKKAEADLRDLTIKLSNSNKELEQFAYIASHDMQEPLRMISSYVQLLEKKYKGVINDEADEFIGYTVNGVKRLKNLINDLLSYSRVSLSSEPYKKIDTNILFSEIETGFKHQLDEVNGQIIFDELHPIYGIEKQLKHLFKNLISNSIKFKGTNPPRIIISSHIQNENIVISINDNGIGIEDEFKEKIFMIFQRLHNSMDYPGTGIGLAICKKIAENHSGKIWFDSEPGIGSTFYIQLPIMHQHDG